MDDDVAAVDIPITFSMSVDEFRELFDEAEPATVDDVPFRFRTPTPLKEPAAPPPAG